MKQPNKYIKGGKYNNFGAVCEALRTKRGVFIENKFYSREFVSHWKLSTIIRHYETYAIYGYYTSR